MSDVQQRECCVGRTTPVHAYTQLSSIFSTSSINSSRSAAAAVSSSIRFCRARRGGVHTKFRPDTTPDASAAAADVSRKRDSKASYAPGECIEVPESFDAAEGEQLSPDLLIDKHIGSGSTADVYKLRPVSHNDDDDDDDGGKALSKGPAQVLKWSKPLPGARATFQREWMLGRRLNAAARQDPALDLLLQTGPAVVSYTTSGSKGKHGEEVEEELVFRGAVLEGLNGKSLDKRLEEDPSFCDIDFLLACLQQVLTALDKAEHLVGFRHGDLRISNIMEHILDPAGYEELLQNPDTWRSKGYESAASAALHQGIMALKLLDWGHSEIHESSSRRVLLAVEKDGATEHDQYLSSSGSGNGGGGNSGSSSTSLALQRLPAASSFIEKVYMFWYKDKSDCWRLFHSLAPRLDGRAWPQRKRERVMSFYELVSELQDVKLQAKFFDDTTVDPDGKVRRLSASEPVYDKDAGEFVKLAELPGQDVTAKPQRWKLLRAVRDIVLRGWSRWFSRRKRVSFRDVLKKMRRRGLLLLPADDAEQQHSEF